MMILKVFPKVGMQLTVYEAYHRLERLFGSEIYPSKKAAGSLGGAVNGGTIALNSHGLYERMR